MIVASTWLKKKGLFTQMYSKHNLHMSRIHCKLSVALTSAGFRRVLISGGTVRAPGGVNDNDGWLLRVGDDGVYP